MAIGGVLFDIDGVLVTSWQPIAGAAEALQVLTDHQIARSYLTNTTTRTRAQIAELLTAIGAIVRGRTRRGRRIAASDDRAARNAAERACRKARRTRIDDLRGAAPFHSDSR